MMFWTKTAPYKKLSNPTWLKTYSNEKAHFKVKMLIQILSKQKPGQCHQSFLRRKRIFEKKRRKQ